MSEAFILRRGGTGALRGGGSAPEFTYTGNYEQIDDGNRNWRIKFLTSGTLTFTTLGNADGGIDVFLMGGGGSGGYGQLYYAGGGGKEGGIKTARGLTVQTQTPYEIVVGAGGSRKGDGEMSEAFGETAAGGEHGKDGVSPGKAGTDSTVKAFEEENGESLGGNGGNGGGSTADFVLISAGKGGKPYGGKGGKYGNSWTTPGHGTAGPANTGAGGGGGGGCTYSANIYGANGGSGIVIIRNAR